MWTHERLAKAGAVGYPLSVTPGPHRLPFLILLSAAGIVSCKDGAASGTCETVEPSGGVVSSSDGTLTLSFRPGSVSEPTQVCISEAKDPAKGGPPAPYGQAYRVTPDIDVGANISVTYRATLPADTSGTAVGVIHREDFEAAIGKWLALPTTRLEPDNDLITGTDTRISMFYGLLDDGGAGPANPDTDSGSDTNADSSGTSTDSTSTTDAQTEGDPDGSDTTGTSTSSDPSTTGETSDETTSGESTAGTTAETTTSDSDTGLPPVDCDNLPAPPYDITQIATLLPGNAEDLAMTGQGTFVIADGDELVEMDGDGNASTWLAGIPYDQDMLGLRFAADGTLYAASGLNGSGIYAFTPSEATLLLEGEFQLSNGLYVDHDGMVWVTDYFGASVQRIDPSGPTIEPVVTTNANNANGVFHDEERGQLFWTNYNASQLWRAPIVAGVVGTPVGVVDLAGRSDGVAMDECGNMYVVDQGGTAGNVPCRIDRVPLDAIGDADGSTVEVASPGDLGNGCANMQFGYGFGDAYDQAGFVTGQAGGVYRIELGVGGYAIPLPSK